jgi:hypothetical protein
LCLLRILGKKFSILEVLHTSTELDRTFQQHLAMGKILIQTHVGEKEGKQGREESKREEEKRGDKKIHYY